RSTPCYDVALNASRQIGKKGPTTQDRRIPEAPARFLVVSYWYCTPGRAGLTSEPVPINPTSHGGDCHERRRARAGRPEYLLLPEPQVPRLRPARPRQSDRPPALRPPAAAAAALPHLQGALLGAQGHPAVRRPVIRGPGRGRLAAHRRGGRCPQDRPPG